MKPKAQTMTAIIPNPTQPKEAFMERLLKADEQVGDRFTAQGNDVEWMMYGWSVLHCLPVGMADGGGCHCGRTGTAMRTDTLWNYTKAAGFQDIEILEIDNFFFRFYRLYA
jgi:hypothetical protein